MIGLIEFCEKAGFQNALSERRHEYLQEKDINETPRNHYYRTTEIRRFMQYLEKIGIDAYVDRDIRRVQSSFVPYIFSHSEIARLFASSCSNESTV